MVSSFLVESQSVPASQKYVQESNIKNYALHEYAGKNRIAFWEACAEQLSWNKKWHTVLEWNSPFAKWFDGGKLNASVNCLDRFMNTPLKDKVALYFEGERGDQQSYTYEQLYLKVNKIANALKSIGVKKGDCVALYLPMIPEAIASMLACARIGAVHTVIFAGFSSESLRDRVLDANAKILITADGGIRKGKITELKKIADKAVEGLTCIEKVLVVDRSNQNVTMDSDRDVWFEDLVEKQEPYCKPEVMEAEDPLFILYTSGTTGKPKGIVHSTGGYLVGANTSTKIVFDVKPKDIFWCTADVGWITGHTYVVYGPLSNGMTQVVYEGSFDQPGKDRIWDIIDKYKVTTLYTAPTAIRLFMKWGEKYLEGKDLSSLRLLGSVGEPLNPEAWHWYHTQVGQKRCPIVDTWWQTETGSIILSTIPSIMDMKPGCVGKPLPGIEAEVFDDLGNPVSKGYVSILSPWPSMLRGIHGDNRRFIQTYWNKWGGRYYLAGDSAFKDENGDYWIEGRIDDTINVSAHRIGTMEVESALVEHEAVVEAAVIGIPDKVTGQAICAFVVLKDGVASAEMMKDSLKEIVADKIGKIAKPKAIFFVQELPKTRSGKIMRRLLKNIALGQKPGDTTTLENEAVIQGLFQK